jgi:hypothetical protein
MYKAFGVEAQAAEEVVKDVLWSFTAVLAGGGVDDLDAVEVTPELHVSGGETEVEGRL